MQRPDSASLHDQQVRSRSSRPAVRIQPAQTARQHREEPSLRVQAALQTKLVLSASLTTGLGELQGTRRPPLSPTQRPRRRGTRDRRRNRRHLPVRADEVQVLMPEIR
jgi:hypothetical protein